MNILTFGNDTIIPINKIDLVELKHDKYESKVCIFIKDQIIYIKHKDYDVSLVLFNDIRELLKQTGDGEIELHRNSG